MVVERHVTQKSWSKKSDEKWSGFAKPRIECQQVIHTYLITFY